MATAVQELSVPRLPTRKRREAAPYFFIAPFYVGFILFQLLPILFSLYLSLATWNGGPAIQFAGLRNFQTLFADGKFWNAFRVTLIITVVCTIVGTIGALALAVFLERVVDWLASLLRVIFFLPSVTSVVVIAYVWRQLYNTDYGYFNTILVQFGLPRLNWLSDSHLQLWALIIMLIWAWPALPVRPTTEVMLTMWPARCRSIGRKAAWMHRKTPVRLVARTLSQSSGFMRSTSVSRVMPALLTRMSSLPKRCWTDRKRVSTASGDDTSQAKPAILRSGSCGHEAARSPLG